MLRLAFAAILESQRFAAMTAANAEVTNTHMAFYVQHQNRVSGDNEAVLESDDLTVAYWNSEHKLDRDAENFYLVAAGRRWFCELIRTTSDDNIQIVDGQRFSTLRVIYAHKQPNAPAIVRPLGPLQGVRRYRHVDQVFYCKPQGDTTVSGSPIKWRLYGIRWTRSLGGGWRDRKEQLTRLSAFVRRSGALLPILRMTQPGRKMTTK